MVTPRVGKRLSRRAGVLALILTAALAMFGAGIALGCNGNYCAPWDTLDCVMIDNTVLDTCCVDVGGGTLRCATCTRETFLCEAGYDLISKLGAGYNCNNPGPACQ